MKSGASDPFADETDAEDETTADDETVADDEAGASVEMDADDEPTADGEIGADDGSVEEVAEELAEDALDDELDGEGIDREDIPWVLRRDAVKDDRPHVHQLFVQEGTDGRARRAESRLEERLGTDVYRLDAREAIYLVGMRHLDEVAEVMEEWGYNL